MAEPRIPSVSLLLLASAFASLAAAAPAAAQVGTVSNVSFQQINWFDANLVPVAPRSVWGTVSFRYAPPPTGTTYMNLTLSRGGPPAWVIQNLPIFEPGPTQPIPLGVGADIDYREIGITEGTPVLSVIYVLTVEAAPRVTPPTAPSASSSVAPLDRRAWDSPEEFEFPGPFVGPGPPAPVKIAGAAQKVGQPHGRDVRSVQEAPNHCFAGATARSLDWLNREHGLGIGRAAQEIYDDLVARGVSQPGLDPGKGRSREKWIERKDAYAREKTGGKIVTKAWDGGNSLNPIPGITESNEPFADWLKREIKTEDVELTYNWPGGGHVVTVLDVYEKDGGLYVKYRDDEEQGDATKGDGVGGNRYPPIKDAKLVEKLDGTYGFRTNANTITWGVSESRKIEVDGRRDPGFTDDASRQRIGTNFGDSNLGLVDFANGSELDVASATIQENTLHLFLAGNLESNFNKLEIFFDGLGGQGQNRLRGDNPVVDFDGLNRMGDDGSGNGLRFDESFAADHWLGLTGGNPGGGYRLFANYAELLTGGGGTGHYLGQTMAGGDGTLVDGHNPFDIRVAIDNSNTGGVGGGCDSAGAGGPTTGIEIAVPLAALGNPTTSLRITTFVNGAGHDFVSNQFLGPLPPGTCNLGEPRDVDLRSIPGEQHFTVDLPIPLAVEPRVRSARPGILAWPNPFRGDVRFRFEAPAGRPTRIDVFDVAGRRMRTFPGTSFGSGSAVWDGRDDDGRLVPAGLYLVRVRAGAVEHTARVLRLP